MAIITVDAEIVAIPTLIELLSVEKVRVLSKTHPMARGFRCFLGLAETPSVDDLSAMWELEYLARTIKKHLVGNVPPHQLIRNLSNEKDCRALAFEARVVASLIEPFVGELSWRRYQEGGSDILTQKPQIQVECTRVNDYSLELMAERVTEKRKLRQRTDGEGPFLLVVGTESSQDSHIFRHIGPALHDDWSEWLGRHGEVSAIYFAAPKTMAGGDRLLEIDHEHVALRFCHFTGFCVRNLKATEPLPIGFEDNWKL